MSSVQTPQVCSKSRSESTISAGMLLIHRPAVLGPAGESTLSSD